MGLGMQYALLLLCSSALESTGPPDKDPADSSFMPGGLARGGFGGFGLRIQGPAKAQLAACLNSSDVDVSGVGVCMYLP